MTDFFNFFQYFYDVNPLLSIFIHFCLFWSIFINFQPFSSFSPSFLCFLHFCPFVSIFMSISIHFIHSYPFSSIFTLFRKETFIQGLRGVAQACAILCLLHPKPQSTIPEPCHRSAVEPQPFPPPLEEQVHLGCVALALVEILKLGEA